MPTEASKCHIFLTKENDARGKKSFALTAALVPGLFRLKIGVPSAIFMFADTVVSVKIFGDRTLGPESSEGATSDIYQRLQKTC